VDLELRREGDVLGSAQTGRGGWLKLLKVFRDADLIAEARALATALVSQDPDLARHADLRDFLARQLAGREDFLERA
jgi:ATP-dependent DNA helicase RecG